MTASGWIAWDADGVLFDSDELHYVAVNEALKPYGERIGEEEHLTTFKGLPTRRKLEMLTAAGRLLPEAHENVVVLKQLATKDAIRQTIRPNFAVTALLMAMQAAGWRQSVCSNAVRATVKLVLEQIDVSEFIDFYLSNEDVANPKPAPDMYRLAAKLFGIAPDQLVVVEDAEPGRRSALAAGCRLVAVDGPADVTPALLHRLVAAGKEANHEPAIR